MSAVKRVFADHRDAGDHERQPQRAAEPQLHRHVGQPAGCRAACASSGRPATHCGESVITERSPSACRVSTSSSRSSRPRSVMRLTSCARGRVRRQQVHLPAGGVALEHDLEHAPQRLRRCRPGCRACRPPARRRRAAARPAASAAAVALDHQLVAVEHHRLLDRPLGILLEPPRRLVAQRAGRFDRRVEHREVLLLDESRLLLRLAADPFQQRLQLQWRRRLPAAPAAGAAGAAAAGAAGVAGRACAAAAKARHARNRGAGQAFAPRSRAGDRLMPVAPCRRRGRVAAPSQKSKKLNQLKG